MLAVLSNVNIEPIKSFLKVDYFGAFDQLAFELSQKSAFCSSQNCKTIWIHLDFGAFLKEKQFQADSYDLSIQALDELIAFTSSFIQKHPEKQVVFSDFSNLHKPIYSFLNLTDSMFSPELEWQFNQKLLDFTRLYPNAYLFPCSQVFKALGTEQILNPKFWYFGRIKYTQKAFKELASLFLQFRDSIESKSKKVLVLDLDGTLWGKVLGEVGPLGVEIGQEGPGLAFREFQAHIRALKQLGVLLALCSKNDEIEAKKAFNENANMCLRWEDFCAHRVNWQSKDENLKALAAELSLGLDSFVFIDDNPVERELIKTQLPQVTVPEFPKDFSALCSWLLQEVVYPYFPRVNLTQEDSLKTHKYKQKAKRSELQSTLSFEDFLATLCIKLELIINSQTHLDRMTQLCQKTNQFNLTLKRFSRENILLFLEKEDYDCFALRYEDKFGDEGIIGLAILRYENDIAFVENFLLSCRVIGRKVELSFFHALLKYLDTKSINEISLSYCKGERNHLCQNLAKDLGFDSICENTAQEKITKLLLKTPPEFISLGTKNQKALL